MPCYRPKDAFDLTHHPRENGKRNIVFSVDRTYGHYYERLQVPCQSCIGCKLDRSRDWALRCVHEGYYYDERNLFLSLTFNPECINPEGTLVKSDWTKFIDKARQAFIVRKGELIDDETRFIRYFHCGEYGALGDRPHHHAILFNFRPSDLEYVTTRNGYRLYRSEKLEECWSKPITAEEYHLYNPRDCYQREGKTYVRLGFITIGELTWETAAYTARYILKKQGRAGENYQHTDTTTGEVTDRIQEYVTMSNRPGLGQRWIKEFYLDFYPHNYILHKGRRLKPPKYYDKWMEANQPEIMEGVKCKKQQQAKHRALTVTQKQLMAEEAIKLKQVEKLERSYENAY